MVAINKDLAEFVGAVIGDGNLWNDETHYRVELTGDPVLDKSYYEEFMSPLIENLFGLKPSIKVRSRGLRLRIHSKKVFKALTDIGVPARKGKCYNVQIPNVIKNNAAFLKACIRGIMDTDGSLFFADKGYRKDYPTIEISTTSEKLAKDIKIALVDWDFRIGFRLQKTTKFAPRYIISLNGVEMVNRWVKEIGFSNPRHSKKCCHLR